MHIHLSGIEYGPKVNAIMFCLQTELDYKAVLKALVDSTPRAISSVESCSEDDALILQEVTANLTRIDSKRRPGWNTPTLKTLGSIQAKVELRGWLYNKRSSGKIQFLLVRDGTGIIQGLW